MRIEQAQKALETQDAKDQKARADSFLTLQAARRSLSNLRRGQGSSGAVSSVSPSSREWWMVEGARDHEKLTLCLGVFGYCSCEGSRLSSAIAGRVLGTQVVKEAVDQERLIVTRAYVVQLHVISDSGVEA